jgi:hypothetical protein
MYFEKYDINSLAEYLNCLTMFGRASPSDNLVTPSIPVTYVTIDSDVDMDLLFIYS